MQPVIVKDVAELVGVLCLERHEHEAFGSDDRRLYRPRAHAPALRPDSIAPSMGRYANGRLANVLGVAYLGIILAVSLSAIPLMILTNVGQS